MPTALSQTHHDVAMKRWSNRQFARSSDGTLIHFQKCYSTFQELFERGDGYGLFEALPVDRPLRFVDIACAPGGFSQFLLDHFEFSEGLGITLPEELGGFPIAVSAYPQERFRVCQFDLLSHPMHPAPLIDKRVDFAIGDAQYFPRSQEALDEYKGRKAGTVTGGRLALLLREFVIALEALNDGGVFVFRFVVWEKVHSNILRLFFLCFDLFENVHPFKSEYQHTADCTFYAVCSGFRRHKYEDLNIGVQLRAAYARVILSPPFAAVHNGTINCFHVVNVSDTPNDCTNHEPSMDKADAHIFESLYPFREMQVHPHFARTCAMFEYVYKMFLIGQGSYTDHSRM